MRAHIVPLSLLTGLALLSSPTHAGQPPASVRERMVSSGIAVEVEMRSRGGTGAIREGEDVDVTLTVTDEQTGRPITGVRPAVWLNRRVAQPRQAPSCAAKIGEFLAGDVFTAADIDLNTFYVVTMNADATVAIADPRFSFGGSRMLGLVKLPGVGYDWALGVNETRLFVTVPTANRVVAIDTSTWKVVGEIDAGAEPGAIAAQPDEARLWVATAAGVSVIDPRRLDVVRRFSTGRGPHRIAVTADNRNVLVAGEGAGTVSIIDARKLRRVADIDAGGHPVALGYSTLSRYAYARTREALVVIDPERRKIVARVAITAGEGPIEVSPNGKLLLVTNRDENVVEIVDTTTNTIIHRMTVNGGPEQFAFSDNLIYIRQERSEQVLMVPFVSLGTKGAPVNAADFPGGERPFGLASGRVAARGMHPVPGETAMLVANPADGEIYYYKEGMAAPMGQFSNDRREPLAVLALDRSMRERAPGRFANVMRMPLPGQYDVAVLIDSPRVTACFSMDAKEDPVLTAAREVGAVRVAFQRPERDIRTGQPTSLRFHLIDPKTNEPRRGISDVRALVYLAPGAWHTRVKAEPTADGGYQIDFTPAENGVYYIHVESASLALHINNPQFVVVQAIQ